MLTAFLLMITAGNLAAHGVIDVTPGFIETVVGVWLAKRFVGRGRIGTLIARIKQVIA